MVGTIPPRSSEFLSQWRIECEEEELALPLRQGFLLRRLLRQGYEGQEGFGGQDGGQDGGFQGGSSRVRPTTLRDRLQIIA